MDTVNNITSSSESDMSGISQLYVIEKEEINYECDTDSDCDSENESIDVICENSEREKNFDAKDLKSNLFPSVQRLSSLYGETSVIVPSKSLSNPKHTNEIQCSVIKPDLTNSDVTVISKSKTFLIDNILGNDNCRAKIVPEEADNYEENTDEHGNVIFKYFTN